MNANGTITENMSGLCLSTSGDINTPGSNVWLFHCNGSPGQKWAYDQVGVCALVAGLVLRESRVKHG